MYDFGLYLYDEAANTAALCTYYRARYYDPNIGRFTSEDPVDFEGGIYAYVDNEYEVC